jgi:DNA-binding GntR family transcriptional regulator
MNEVPLKLNLEDGGTLENAVYQTLKRGIYSGYFSPGVRLVESTLAKELNVGRTPLREAIKKLGAEGLLEIVPNKGATVTRLSPKDVEEMYLIGGVLEGIAASIAVERLESKDIQMLRKLHDEMKDEKLQMNYVEWMNVNYKFHHIYLKASQRPLLLRKIKEVDSSLPLYWYMGCSILGMLETSISKHQEMVNAFENRDAELVRRRTEEHLIYMGRKIREHLENISRII